MHLDTNLPIWIEKSPRMVPGFDFACKAMLNDQISGCLFRGEHAIGYHIISAIIAQQTRYWLKKNVI